MTLLWHYYDTIMRSIITSIMTQGTIMTLLSHYYHNIMTLFSHYYHTIITLLWTYSDCIITPLWLYYHSIITLMTVLYILWRNICTPFLGMCRQQSFTWTRGNYNEVSIKFGAWFQPTGGRTATVESSWSELNGTIIHIISSIIQFIADVWPGLRQL